MNKQIKALMEARGHRLAVDSMCIFCAQTIWEFRIARNECAKKPKEVQDGNA